MTEHNDIEIPEQWRAEPLRLEDSEPELRVSATALKEDSEIKRLSALAEQIPPRTDREMPFNPGDNPGHTLGFPYSRGVSPT